jgi:hypothetical protein
MKNIPSGCLCPPSILALLVALAGCNDSGHSLGSSRDSDAGISDGRAPTAGTTGTGGISSVTQIGGNGGVSSALGGGGGGASGNTTASGGSGGRSSAGAPNDAGAGMPNQDGGRPDAAPDLVLRSDAGGGGSVCGPGYPVGSTKPLGDGCNICTCLAGGVFACTTATCAAPDAAMDAGPCPAGQIWCPSCTPGVGSCGTACTGLVCPTDAAVASETGPGSCSQAKTQEACEARSDCHPVFDDPGTCGCASSGCCARFSLCKEGGKASCVSPSPGGGFCDMATPLCEAPYVIAYTSWCYEGCVLQTECAP